jgi:hypothetical protein
VNGDTGDGTEAFADGVRRDVVDGVVGVETLGVEARVLEGSPVGDGMTREPCSRRDAAWAEQAVAATRVATARTAARRGRFMALD